MSTTFTTILFFIKMTFLLYVFFFALISRKKNNLYIFLIAIPFILLAKNIYFFVFGFKDIYNNQFNFISPLYYIMEDLISLIISSTVIWFSGQKQAVRKYLIINTSIFALFFLTGFVVLYLFFEMGLLSIITKIDKHGSYEVVQFSRGLRGLNENIIASGIFEGIFTLYWVFIHIHIFVMPLSAIISALIKKDEKSHKYNFFLTTKALFVFFIIIIALSVLPYPPSYRILSTIAAITLFLILKKLQKYFLSCHATAEQRTELIQETIKNAKKEVENYNSKKITPKQFSTLFLNHANNLSNTQCGAIHFLNTKTNLLDPGKIEGDFPAFFKISESILSSGSAENIIKNKVHRTSIEIDNTLPGNAIQNNTSMLIEDTEQSPLVPTEHGLAKMGSAIAVPFQSKNEVKGVITLLKFKSEVQFNKIDINAIEQLAQLIENITINK